MTRHRFVLQTEDATREKESGNKFPHSKETKRRRSHELDPLEKQIERAGPQRRLAAGENSRAILHEKWYATDLKQPVYP